MSRDEISTERLSLRRLRADDLDELAAIFEQREVWEYEYGRGLTRSETEAFLERQLNLWAEHGFGGYAARTEGRLVGVAGLAVPTIDHESIAAVTIGWRFAREAWGHGYATEAARALLDEAFKTTDRVSCVTNAENARSIAVAHRLGMREVAEIRTQNDDGGGVTAVVLECRAART